MKKSAFLFWLAFVSVSAFSAPLNVLLWDRYFDPIPDGPEDTSMGQWGQVFAWDPAFANPYSGKNKPAPHGLWMSYALRKDLPDVIVHRAHDEFLPWQDPEVCVLTHDQEFNRELKKFNYKPLPLCRRDAEKRIKDLTAFIQTNNIKLVNMSHGIFIDTYNDKNALLIHKTYPELDMNVIYRFLYKNFLAVGEVIQNLFETNPNVLFVVAAGNNSREVDRVEYLKFSYKEQYPIPTWWASFASRYANVIAVAATNEGVRLDYTSNYGKQSVDFAKLVGGMSAPNGRGGQVVLNQTSGATAVTTRLFAIAMLKYQDKLSLTPEFIKKFASQVVTPVPSLKDTITSGGMLEDQVFLDGLEKLWQKELTRYPGAGWADSLSPITILPVKEIQGQADEYQIIPTEDKARPQSCEQVRSDANGIAWLSYPWQNSIVRFDPDKHERKDFLLDPQPADPSQMKFTGPDGIYVGASGNIWYGEYQNGFLGMIDPSSNQSFRFDPKAAEVAIVAEGPDGHVWATSHQAKTIWEYDPSGNQFHAWKTRQEWPRDVRADRFGQAWVTAGGSDAVLLRLDRDSGIVFEYPIVKDAGAMWLDQDPDERYVYITTQQKGLFVFDKLTKSFKNIQREDADHQNYLPISVSKDGLIAIGNTSGSNYLSIDVINPKSPDQILAYRVPTQAGLLKEGLSFDPQNRVWYCQTYTNLVGRLHL